MLRKFIDKSKQEKSIYTKKFKSVYINLDAKIVETYRFF